MHDMFYLLVAIFITFYFLPPKIFLFFSTNILFLCCSTVIVLCLLALIFKKKLQVLILFALKQKVPHEILHTEISTGNVEAIYKRVGQVQTTGE